MPVCASAGPGATGNQAHVVTNVTNFPGFCLLTGTVDLDSIFLHECCGTCAPLLGAAPLPPSVLRAWMLNPLLDPVYSCYIWYWNLICLAWRA
jgi:hypothetical protein